MGAKVSVCGPSTMIPRYIEELGVDVIYDIDEAIQENDVLNVLRIQLERKAREYFPSIREYAKYFGIDSGTTGKKRQRNFNSASRSD